MLGADMDAMNYDEKVISAVQRNADKAAKAAMTRSHSGLHARQSCNWLCVSSPFGGMSWLADAGAASASGGRRKTASGGGQEGLDWRKKLGTYFFFSAKR